MLWVGETRLATRPRRRRRVDAPRSSESELNSTRL